MVVALVWVSVSVGEGVELVAKSSAAVSDDTELLNAQLVLSVRGKVGERSLKSDSLADKLEHLDETGFLTDLVQLASSEGVLDNIVGGLELRRRLGLLGSLLLGGF